LRLDLRLVVGEVEHAAALRGVVGDALAGRHLGREGDRPVGVVGVVDGVAVGDVQLGGLVGVVAGDGRLGVVAGQRGREQVVGAGRVDLPAVAVQQQLGG